MAEAHLIATHVERPVAEVQRFLANPRNYPRWAAVVEATFRQVGPLEWAADTDFGPRLVRFSPPNDEGIFDHAVYAAGEEPVMMPLPTSTRMITADAAARRVVVLEMASDNAVCNAATHAPPATMRASVMIQCSGESGP